MKRLVLLLLCGLAAALFCGLGVWQLERRVWKLELIARVDARVHAAAVPPPPPPQWAGITAAQEEYRRVRVTGVFRHDRTVLVDALTELGAGFWVVTPLAGPDGTVLINRGFVPSDHRQDYARPDGPVVVTGLLRMTEPDGRFLRPNDVRAGLWYSRDVQAIARYRHLAGVAPYFVDAEAGPVAGYPIGGLTVVQFRNAHLVYALTWFALSGMSLTGLWLLLKRA